MRGCHRFLGLFTAESCPIVISPYSLHLCFISLSLRDDFPHADFTLDWLTITDFREAQSGIACTYARARPLSRTRTTRWPLSRPPPEVTCTRDAHKIVLLNHLTDLLSLSNLILNLMCIYGSTKCVQLNRVYVSPANSSCADVASLSERGRGKL